MTETITKINQISNQNIYITLFAYFILTLSILEILQQKKFTQGLRDLLTAKHKFNKQKGKNSIISGIFEEWALCQVCGSSQTIYVFVIINLFLTNYLVAFWLLVLAIPFGLMIERIYRK